MGLLTEKVHENWFPTNISLYSYFEVCKTMTCSSFDFNEPQQYKFWSIFHHTFPFFISRSCSWSFAGFHPCKLQLRLNQVCNTFLLIALWRLMPHSTIFLLYRGGSVLLMEETGVSGEKHRRLLLKMLPNIVTDQPKIKIIEFPLLRPLQLSCSEEVSKCCHISIKKKRIPPFEASSTILQWIFCHLTLSIKKKSPLWDLFNCPAVNIFTSLPLINKEINLRIFL